VVVEGEEEKKKKEVINDSWKKLFVFGFLEHKTAI